MTGALGLLPHPSFLSGCSLLGRNTVLFGAEPARISLFDARRKISPQRVAGR